ncbi:MAG: NAD-dependent epimerase/dehydratase family protein [Gemmatales bacterium]
MSLCQVVTGATGLLGSHLAEQLTLAGHRVRALVRPTSDTEYLQSIGVECLAGDLGDAASLRQAMNGADTVYHSAAKVGDWGRPSEFQRDTVEGTRNVAEACLAAGVRRLVHVSSTSAYGHPSDSVETVDETHPLGERFWIWDYYTRAKVEAERLLWAMYEKQKLPLTVVRPSWLYGPRDRLSIHRMHGILSQKKVRIIGPGTNRMNTIYAGSVARCCLLAAASEKALGQAYNATNDGIITQQGWFDLWAEEFGLPKPTVHVPYKLAFHAGLVMEACYRAVGAKKPPLITRYAAWLLGRPTYYVTGKAERELGWSPMVRYPEGVRLAVEWYRGQQGQLATGKAS